MTWQPGAPRALSADHLTKWQSRIERAERKAKQFYPQWERALERYAKAKVETAPTNVNALLDYRHVESKKSQLFHRTPEVQLAPVDPQDQSIPVGQILPLRQKYLNYKLGPNGANAKAAIHKTLVDALATSGWMACEVGYESRTVTVEQLQRPMFDPLAAPVKVKVPVPIWERCFITRISPKKLLIPDDFHDTDYDAAPWLGVKGVIPTLQARALGWKLPADFTGGAQRDEHIFDHGLQAESGEDLTPYTKIWYLASFFDEAVIHPELFRCLILVEGVDEPVKHADSPYQTIDQMGRLTDDSLIGNPIHVGTLRDLPDSAYVPSDLVIGEQLSTEVNAFRTDLVRNRRARRPRVVVAVGLGQEVTEKLVANEGPVPVPDEYIDGAGNQRAMSVIQTGSEPRDNYTGQDFIERDYEQALGMSANQSGQFSKSKRTATEVRNVQGNSSARAETEKDRIREWVVALFRKFDTIEQRYATSQQLTKVLGKQGAQLWMQWQALPGKYAYDILPDAGQHIDAQQLQSMVIDLYNLLRKDERVSTEELLTMVARAFNRDPAKFIAPPADKTTEPPSASVTFKGEDTANVAMGNLLLDFCANAGIKLRPETIQAFKEQHEQQLLQQALGGPAIGAESDPDGHGGSADRTEPVNQHQTERTGALQGVGVQ